MGNAPRKSPVAEKPAAEVEEALEADHLDPRSPTPDVARTPLAGKNGVKHKITKNADLSKTLESGTKDEKIVHNNPILSAVIRSHLQSYDPRSPTHEFERTPIVIAANRAGEHKPAHAHNGSVSFEGDGDAHSMDPDVVSDSVPKNLSEDFLDATLDSTFRDPEPLGSSTASRDAIESETSRVEPKVLLETDFEYVPIEQLQIQSDAGDKIQSETPVLAALRDKIKNRFKIIETDPRSPSQGIDRTPIVVQQQLTNTSDGNVEDMSEASLVAALQSGIADFRRTPALNSETDIGLLIYEDDAAKTVDLTPRKTQSATKGNRTPLSCMKNKAEDRSKSAAAVVEAKKNKIVSRIPKRIGIKRVPSLKKSMSELRKDGTEFENTPPSTHRDAWDKQSSIVL